MIGMDVSTENAVAYLCMAVVAVTAIIGYVYLIAHDKIDPPHWMGRPKGGDDGNHP